MKPPPALNSIFLAVSRLASDMSKLKFPTANLPPVVNVYCGRFAANLVDTVQDARTVQKNVSKTSELSRMISECLLINELQ